MTETTETTETMKVEDIEIRLLLEALYHRYHYDFRSYAMSSIRRRLRQAREQASAAAGSAHSRANSAAAPRDTATRAAARRCVQRSIGRSAALRHAGQPRTCSTRLICSETTTRVCAPRAAITAMLVIIFSQFPGTRPLAILMSKDGNLPPMGAAR